MPHFKFRCVNKQGETYDISREGPTYEDAKRQAIEDRHSVLPAQPSSFASGTDGVFDAPAGIPSIGGRDSNLILESIDAKLSEVLKFTKLARIVLIVMICFWVLGFCIWLAAVAGIIGTAAGIGRSLTP